LVLLRERSGSYIGARRYDSVVAEAKTEAKNLKVSVISVVVKAELK
jgi:hypothetical protein